MHVLLGIVAYLTLAVLTGRFLALSHRGAVSYGVPNGATAGPPLYTPAETANLETTLRPAEKGRRERSEARERVSV